MEWFRFAPNAVVPNLAALLAHRGQLYDDSLESEIEQFAGPIHCETRMPQTFTDIACTVCGCVCDDLQITIDSDHIKNVRGACPLAEPWFSRLAQPEERVAADVEGRPVTFEEAVVRAADILRTSRAPLIWGLARSSTAGQRAAIALAEQLGGTIDTPTSLNPAATLAFQNVGQSTCSLGEVKNRADVVIFWGADPFVNHPRHWERYSVEPKGLSVPGGRADRRVIVVGSAATETSRHADEFLPIKPGSDRQFIEVLRQMVNGNDLTLDLDFGVTQVQAQQLAEQMKSCRYGALFFGAGQGTSEESCVTVESLFRMVTELNRTTRFTVHYMPATGGLAGADNVLSWQTGFPFAVNFASGYPRFDPQEFSANRLLEQGAADACVLVGSEAVPRLSMKAQEALKRIPTITLDYPNMDPAVTSTVHFRTAIYGIHSEGTAYRMDGIPIPLRKVLPSNYPSDDEVLAAIAIRLRESRALNR